MSRRVRQLDQILFCRSYLITLGLILFAGSATAAYLAAAGAFDVQTWGIVVISAILLLGAALLLLGIFGSNSRMEGLADIASGHEAALVIMLVSYPLYRVLKFFLRSR